MRRRQGKNGHLLSFENCCPANATNHLLDETKWHDAAMKSSPEEFNAQADSFRRTEPASSIFSIENDVAASVVPFLPMKMIRDVYP